MEETRVTDKVVPFAPPETTMTIHDPQPAASPGPDANSDADARFMHHALQLAAQARGWVEPNPMVGAVIVKDHRIVAEGYHQQFGQAHAEVNAIAHCRQQGIDPAGLTMYVTLEPCTHFGKQPPCTDAIVNAKLARVVVGMVDPFEKVAGRGIAQLRQAGVQVDVGVCEAQAIRLNRPFIKRVTLGLPWIYLKWAQTLDGYIAAADGQSKWISNDASRRLVHLWRGQVDAIMVGIGTLRQDNPTLTARNVPIRRTARRVIVDRHLHTPLDVQLLNDQGPPVTIAIADHLLQKNDPAVREKHDALIRRGVELISLPARNENDLDLRPLFDHLAQQHQASSVMVEGGSVLNQLLLQQQLADQARIFIAPRLLGDANAIPPVRGRSCQSMKQGYQLTLEDMQNIDDDLLLDYRIVYA